MVYIHYILSLTFLTKVVVSRIFISYKLITSLAEEQNTAHLQGLSLGPYVRYQQRMVPDGWLITAIWWQFHLQFVIELQYHAFVHGSGRLHCHLMDHIACWYCYFVDKSKSFINKHHVMKKSTKCVLVTLLESSLASPSLTMNATWYILLAPKIQVTLKIRSWKNNVCSVLLTLEANYSSSNFLVLPSLFAFCKTFAYWSCIRA